MSVARPLPSFSAMATALAAFALASCSSLSTVKVPEKVYVQVPVACVQPEKRPQKPEVRTEDDLMALDRYRRTLAAWSDLTKLRGYAAELEAVVEGCARIPSTTEARP